MRKSAGLLLYRYKGKTPEYFLVHPGGPFWKNKDAGAWSVPKGEFTDDEDPLAAAKREFEEETSLKVDGDFLPLKPSKQKSGKIIYTWAIEADLDPELVKSNIFSLEWPPRSGKYIDIPEVDKGGWFDIEEVKIKIIPGQLNIVEELAETLNNRK